MTNPPTYEAALVELKKLQATPLPASVINTAQAAMAAEAEKPETAANLLDEVRALADSAVKVDQAFERVKIDLGKVDQNNYKDKDGKPVEKFQPKWIAYQKIFTTLLWDSRATATGTEAYVRDFLDVIIPGVEGIVTPQDYQDTVADLKEFINRKDPFGKKLNSTETVSDAQKHSQAFTDLRRDISAFKDTFDTFASFHEGELKGEILRLEGEVLRLDAEIKKCETIVIAMGVALGVTVIAAGIGAVAAIAALGPFGPAVALGIIIVGAIAAIGELSTLIAFVVKGNEYKNERAEDQRQLEDLRVQLATLQRLKTILEAQKTDIADICGRLDRFAAVWALVAHDAQLIADGLKAATDAADDGGSKRAFQNRLKLIKANYTSLADALKEYATQVDQSGIPQKR
ncbi:hypothetical protein FPV67DRAFT_995495 [Lyophyllum atratum]|nr:hypothetical protein FPV67DRAFT_995495 [Lyophyllum atratum]